jgi:hypothetical protein
MAADDVSAIYLVGVTSRAVGQCRIRRTDAQAGAEDPARTGASD